MGLFNGKSHGERIALLENAVRTLVGTVETLDDALQRLKAQHESLRGYTYSLKAAHVAGLQPQQAAAPAQAQTRDELRRLSGFKPGKPMEHKDGT